MVNMSKETAMKPIERIANYLKYGFAITEHQYMDCPRCGHVLDAGPDYQPKYCGQCGQRVSFHGAIWKEDRHLGYISEKGAERDVIPEWDWVKGIIAEADSMGIPVFMK